MPVPAKFWFEHGYDNLMAPSRWDFPVTSRAAIRLQRLVGLDVAYRDIGFAGDVHAEIVVTGMVIGGVSLE